MQFLQHPPRFLFFTGKGGVGKTSLACATAVRLAESSRQVLLVSTDRASNVGQVFGISIGNQILPIASVPQLSALEINPQAAAQHYREQVLASKGAKLDAAGRGPRAARCWRRTCARPAPRRSRCSRPSRASSARRAASSS